VLQNKLLLVVGLDGRFLAVPLSSTPDEGVTACIVPKLEATPTRSNGGHRWRRTADKLSKPPQVLCSSGEQHLILFAKMRKQHNLTVGKLKRIMVRAGVVRVHLPETCDPVRQRRAPSEQKLKSSEMALDLFSKATSVPGSRQTATLGSSTAEKPRVVVFQKCVVTSLSPILADLAATPCRL
jgi:hypothetical protein